MKIYGDPQAVVVPHSVWDEALEKAEKIGRLRHSWKGNAALHEGIIGQIIRSLIQTKVDRARKLDTRELSTNGYIASLPSAIKSALGL